MLKARRQLMKCAGYRRVCDKTDSVAHCDRFALPGFRTAGAVPEGGKPPWEVDLTSAICLVFGGEGEGLRPLVARTCDLLVTLPMKGRLTSVNVSAAAAVLCFEVVRQRSTPRERPRRGGGSHLPP